ncbi:MAG: UDP-N-acetylmuramate--L-alanine ligase [Alphaproteobacteria bacterium]|nr:UDP-N-acetylmuramate--L-alanine ligase [Alphaproteobacteria bacterium]
MKLPLPLKKIHFIGIGGIGMSAIAEMLHDIGISVQGSDAVQNANTLRVAKQGIPVFIGHDLKNLDGADAVVISSAIKPDNPELIEARRRGLPIGHRSEMLAEILKYKQSICVSGTHGKTTTSSLIASLMMESGKKPSFIIGGILNAKASNAQLGKGDWVVVEADESDGSFLRLPTTISVITNIDPEHLDYYRTFENEKNAYRTFIQKTAFYGCTVACFDHPVVRELIASVPERKIITYGLSKQADVHPDHIRPTKTGFVLDVFVRQGHKFRKLKDVTLSLMGEHNIANAMAMVAVGSYLNLSDKAIRKTLSSFKGIQRRLTLRGSIGHEVYIYDDYAHHPVEIRATIKALKNSAPHQVIAVFQPHRYTRLRDLWQDFLGAFDEADAVLVCDVYSAGESPIPDITGAKFAQELSQKHRQVQYVPDFENLPVALQKVLQPQDYIVCLGAGSISAQSVVLAQKMKGMVKC